MQPVAAADRKIVIAKYRQWLWTRIQDGRIDRDCLADLAGEDIVCHCAPNSSHAPPNGSANGGRPSAPTRRSNGSPVSPPPESRSPSWDRLCRFTAPDRIVGARPAGAVGVRARSRRLPDNCAGAAASRAGSRSGAAGHGQTTCRPGETGAGEDFSPRRGRSLSVRPPCGERPRRLGALTHRPGGLP